jgi:hypothetical protein
MTVTLRFRDRKLRRFLYENSRRLSGILATCEDLDITIVQEGNEGRNRASADNAKRETVKKTKYRI